MAKYVEILGQVSPHTDQRPNRGGERREVDTCEKAQDTGAVPSETARCTLANHRQIPTVPKGQLHIRGHQLLDGLQEAQKSHQRVRNNKRHLLPLRKA